MNIRYDSLQLDNVLSAIAHTKRRGIIHDLSLTPATIGQLARNHELSLPAIHKHIRILENADLITRKKSGRTNFLALKPNSLKSAQTWINQYRLEWSSGDATLENYIAKMQE